MRIFVLGDPHFKKDNLHIFEGICNEILSIIDERKPDLCVCLGDTLDTHDRIYLRAQTMAMRFFADIARRCPLIILIGNHDRENNSDFMSKVHPFVGLESHPDLIFCHQEFNGCNMGMVVSTKGDVWSDKYPLIIAGHIHEYQTLPKIIY